MTDRRMASIPQMTQHAMAEALRLARAAGEVGEVPVGAVVLDACGEVIGVGKNCRETQGDPLAHAEVAALHQAARFRCSQGMEAQGAHVQGIDAPSDPHGAPTLAGGAWNLSECTLVVTLEPCPMCAGAALEAHIGRIVFGAWDAKLGACGSVWDIPRDPHIGARPEVFGGMRENDCATLLRDFFASRRDR